ncbi:MAG: PAS domain S-box protein [Thermodesulfobacteriota bacterium]
MKLPSYPNDLINRIKSRLGSDSDQARKASYEELENRVRELEEELSRRSWTAGLLWKSQEMFEKAFSDNPDSVAIVRRSDGAFLDVNPGFVRLFHYTPDEVAGKTPDELESWANTEERHNFMRELAQNGQVIGMEARFRTKEGQIVHGLISAWPIEIMGEPLVLTITRDLTERKRAEELLNVQRDLGIGLSEARSLRDAARRMLKAALNISGIDCGGVYIVDSVSGGLFLVAHTGFSRAVVARMRRYGQNSTQMQVVMDKTPVFGLFGDLCPDDPSGLGGSLACAMVPVEYEGNVVALIVLGSRHLERFPDSSKNAVESIAARMGGVIARLEAEAALAESEERFATFMDLLPGMVFMKDDNGHFIYVNRYVEQTFGKKKWIGQPMNRVFDDKTAARLTAEDRRALAGETLETIGVIPDREGRERAYRTFKFPILRAGKPKMIGGIAIDISKQVEAERGLLKTLHEKEILLKEVHHRVKNNMQVISSLLTLQAAQLKDESIKRAFTDSQNRIKAMALVHETLYKSENLAEIDLGLYVNTVARSLFDAYGAADRNIAFDIEAEGITFGVTYAVPCGMIINELFTNSLKHAFPEGRPGRISFSARAVENGVMEMIIADNGVGIPEGFALNRATTLGIGLVVGLVQNQLGGSIEAHTIGGTRIVMRFSYS